MTNHIREIGVFETRLDPAEAEIRLSVYPERLTSTTEVRGRLMGPRCCYTSTVEVAYPLREHARAYESEDTPHFTMRVIIPEPSFWDPESPFLYQGPVELWQQGQCCDQVQITRGLRTFALSAGSLRWNGRPLPIRGISCDDCSEETARRLHQEGYNSLLVPNTAALADIADRFGFLLLRRATCRTDLFEWKVRCEDPAYVGPVMTQELLADELVQVLLLANSHELMGLVLSAPPPGPLPQGLAFVLCLETLLPSLTALPLPKIVLVKDRPPDAPQATALLAQPGILGWIRT